MWLACFAPLDKLAEYVMQPQKFREQIQHIVIVMSDQIPFFIKIRPGKQLYAPWEVSTKKSERNSSETLLGSDTGGGNQKVEALSR